MVERQILDSTLDDLFDLHFYIDTINPIHIIPEAIEGFKAHVMVDEIFSKPIQVELTIGTDASVYFKNSCIFMS